MVTLPPPPPPSVATSKRQRGSRRKAFHLLVIQQDRLGIQILHDLYSEFVSGCNFFFVSQRLFEVSIFSDAAASEF